MTQMLTQWRQAYDYVLIDTPPILGLSDSQSMVTKVDRVVLVCAIEQASRSSLMQTMETLRHTGCTLAGVVINMVKSSRDGYYYNYYSYYEHDDRTNGKVEEPFEEAIARTHSMFDDFMNRE
jgi:Mrp family chromosome partitioning ATPase